MGTAALIFEKSAVSPAVAPGFSPASAALKGGATRGATQSVWFYDLTADGFSLDDKRTPIAANDIPDLLTKWPKRDEGPNSYRVPIEKIRENDFSLAAGKYKPVTLETVKHDHPRNILTELLTIEQQITEQTKKLLDEVGR